MQAENTKFLEYCLHISVLNLGDPIQSIPIWCGTLCIYLACLHVYLCSKSEAFTGDGGVKSIYSIFQWVFKSQRVLSPPSPGKKTNLIPPPGQIPVYAPGQNVLTDLAQFVLWQLTWPRGEGLRLVEIKKFHGIGKMSTFTYFKSHQFKQKT